MSIPSPLRALLADLVDYAGLFPPAGLAMGPAAVEFDRQRRSPEAWMLARFVVPTARLDELEEAILSSDTSGNDGPWRLSVLPGHDLVAAREEIDAFHERIGGAARVESIELRAPAADVVERGARVFEPFEIFFEIAHDADPEPLMQVVSTVGGAAKIRTGAIVADPIPSLADVARFLRAAARRRIAFKATAGLHHPLRAVHPLTYEEGAPRAMMHGFLNVFLAAAFLDHARDEDVIGRRSFDDDALLALLTEEDPSSLRVSETALEWRGRRLSTEALARSRASFARSFGSCSFSEPVDDLKSLGHL